MTEVHEKIHILLAKLPKSVMMNVLLAALDEMQSYNGQNHTSAICRAIGAEEVDGENGTRWSLPSIAKIKKDFK
jgi:hypothetical protein